VLNKDLEFGDIMIIGELYDQGMAESLKHELIERGITAQVQEVQQLSADQRTNETIYQLNVADQEQAQEALEFFRVRMGLPGARREPDPEWQKIHALKMGTITKGILGISLLIYLIKMFGPQEFENLSMELYINRPGAGFLEDVLQGEIWRLVTPIFLHFSFMHILFNGMWIKDLGAVYESEKGARSFILFILAISIASNLLQYMAMGPRFGGLSGLVYGLLGYLWVYGVSHTQANIRLPKRDVYLIVGWYFLCLTGVMGPIANVAHGAGLGLGMIWGLFPLQAGQGHIKQKIKYIAMALFFSFGTYIIELLKGFYL